MRKYKMLYSIGDSISLGYLRTLVILLGQRYVVVHCPSNGGPSTRIAERLDDWLAGYDPDVVLLNCGLHDIKRDEDDHPATSADHYEANLRDIVARLQGLAVPPRLIWARTTPVIDERHQAVKSFGRMNEDVIAYNEIADAVMAEMDAESIDLYGVVMDSDPEARLAGDGVHFTSKGYGLLGEAIADYLLREQA